MGIIYNMQRSRRAPETHPSTPVGRNPAWFGLNFYLIQSCLTVLIISGLAVVSFSNSLSEWT